MSGLRSLRSRLRLVYREIAKFGAVGAVGVLVNIGVFNLVRHSTELQTVRASILATVVSIAFNYLGFRYFTYRDRDKAGRTRELSLFLFFSAIGLVIENGVLYLATYAFGWDSQLQSNVFKFAGIGVATLFRFWSYRTWVFRTMPARGAVEQAESFLTGADRRAPAQPRPKRSKADADKSS
ncbi:GtrA family protein [Actinacidiphila sp. ITFR-21]|uniref:GtrA family protein n=1 Tax=Actinacidiphila sp. ITFR-21 TaxID=3075199 RepID=UPI00288A0079|nr:GtrA family protein [Streptomyces sp. ITFR-21]WNI15799.1 GtrA family protein [Streptomyces sp. ITFR-21]